MSWTVSIRDTERLRLALGIGEPLLWPLECRHNALVIKTLLGYVPKVLPGFANLSDDEVQLVADSTAYLLRPDMIINSNGPCFPPLLRGTVQLGIRDGKVHLRKNPEILNPDWKLDREDPSRDNGAEFFRCYEAIMEWAPKIQRKITTEGPFTAAFPMADVTAYLLTPNDLEPYEYGGEELRKFNETIYRQ